MQGKCILITGASSGIGRSMANYFCNKGAIVYALARREERLIQLKQQVDFPNNLHVVPFDVTKTKELSSLMDGFKEKKAAFDFVLQNAGVIGPIKPLGQVSEEDWRQTFDVNVHAPFFLVQAIFRSQLLAPDARILHMGSGAAHFGISSWGAYNCTKGAFLQLFRYLNSEVEAQKLGFSVGSLMPGIVESEMVETVLAADPADFPMAQDFQGFKEKAIGPMSTQEGYKPPVDGFDHPDNVSKFVEYLLIDTSNEEFKKEWDIRDESHHKNWIN